MNNEAIRCADLVKTYNAGEVNEYKALKGVNLTIKEGDFISIIGSSGSGKSTLLNLISCLDTPTSGEVFIDGTALSDLGDNDRAHLRNQKLGFIFQQFNLLRGMTTYENVELTMRFAGIGRTERHERVLELLKKVGLENKRNNRPTELSGGEQQRVAIARALANDPQIILGDEPTGNLDTTTGATIMELLIELNQDQGKTLVMVTHDPAIARKAQRTVRIKDGVLEEEVRGALIGNGNINGETHHKGAKK
ncbi:MAG: ABC transporter ATP-binding protein [Candidatus Altiarchaeia archaeon]